MSVATVRRRIDEKHHGLDLLDALPPYDSFVWEHYHAAEPPVSLRIGVANHRDILAYLIKFADKPRELRFSARPHNYPHTSVPLIQGDVARLSLDAPFKYNVDASNTTRGRKFSIVIKWYFMLKGLVSDGFGVVDLDDYCRRFFAALQAIDAGQRAEKEKAQNVQDETRITRIMDDSTGLGESRSVLGLRSGSARRVQYAERSAADYAERASAKPRSPQRLGTSSFAINDKHSDYQQLRRFLENHDVVHLLKNIPDADEVEFLDQADVREALPQKLFIGRHAGTDDRIFAYMRPSREWHEINYWVENTQQIKAESVAEQHIFHPFNKCYPQGGFGKGGVQDRARLGLMVKWYFIASGNAGNVVLQETKGYPQRLRSALEYIAQRMGAAAYKPQNGRAAVLADVPPVDVDESDTDASDIVPNPSAPRPGSTAIRRGINTITLSNGKKRTAEDAYFASLSRTLRDDEELTKSINEADEKLELYDLKRQNFIDRWEKDRLEVVKKKHELERARSEVRDKFKKQRAAVEGLDEG